MIGRRVLLSVLLAAFVGSLGAASVVSAGEPSEGQRVQVTLAPVEATGPEGVAILTAAAEATSVQVYLPGAPVGTSATIHPGACDAVGADLVGLIGQLSEAGQAQAIVPIPLAQLSDGAHVIALHPGLDFSIVLVCGAIPAGTIAPPLPEPVDADCAGVPEWVASVEAYLDRIKELQDSLRRIVDVNEYLAAVATNVGQAQVMIAEMQVLAVPDAAGATHAQLIAVLQSGVEAALDLIDAFATSDPALYQEAILKAQAADEELLKVRTAIGELTGRCPAPAEG